MKKLRLNKLITLCLSMLFALIFLLSTFYFLDIENKKVVFAGKEDNTYTYDDNVFEICQEQNIIYSNDTSCKTMQISVRTQNEKMYNPYNSYVEGKYNCSWDWICPREKHNYNADFKSATLTLSLYSFGTSLIPDKKICDYTLTCKKDSSVSSLNGFKWTANVTKYFDVAEEINLRIAPAEENSNFLTPFVQTDELYYSLDFLITAENFDVNYYISFSYDYSYYFYMQGELFGISAGHYHKATKHIQSEEELIRDTGTIYDIYDNMKGTSKFDTSSEIIDYYGLEMFESLESLTSNVIDVSTRISFLKPLIVNGKELPFAYKCTYDITVPMISGKITFDSVVKVLFDNGYIQEEHEKSLLKCLNSNVEVDTYLHNVIDPLSSTDYNYMLKYNATYIVNFKTSSGDNSSRALSLTNFYDYYKEFIVGNNVTFPVIELDYLKAIFNNILNVYNLSEEYYRLPKDAGINAGNVLSIHDLYGYWGFALVPIGGGVDSFLSKYFNCRLNSNGIVMPYSCGVKLDKKTTDILSEEFKYSALDNILFDFNNILNGGNNATLYLFYVDDISNNFVYTISENGSLDVFDTKGVADKNFLSASKKVFKSVKSFINKNFDLIFIVTIIAGIVFVFFIIIRFFK